MKSLSILAISAAFVFLVVLGSPAAYAQQEIDPDHFDSPNPKPMPGPRTSSDSKVRAIRYRGTFSLPYSVLCNGKKLAQGRYSIALRSDGNTGQATFNSNGHSVERAGIVRAAPRKEGDQVVVVENSENGRNLSVVRVHGFDFVFDARHSADPSANGMHTGVQKLALTAIATNEIKNQARGQAAPKPQGD
jgi:hypothetical protein